VSTTLTDRVPCTAKALHGGKPCGKCRICKLATTDPLKAKAWGMPLPEGTSLPESPKQSVPRRPLSLRKFETPRPTGGVGTELLKIFKAAGFEACQACNDLARKMDSDGVAVCEVNAQQIVGEVLNNAGHLKRFSRVWSALLLAKNEPGLALRLKDCGLKGDQESDRCRVKMMLQEAISRAYRHQSFTVRSTDTEQFSGPSKPHSVCSQYRPIDRSKLKRSLFFHVWPVAGPDSGRWYNGGRWKWNIQQIAKRRHLFNGKITVGIALGGHRCFDLDDVLRELHFQLGSDFEALACDNDASLREGVTFQPFLDSLDVSDPNEITLISQSKGVTWGNERDAKRNQAIDLWCEWIWRLACDYPDLVTEQLEHFALTGPFRKTGGFDRLADNRNWHYSGSFCWFRNIALAGRDYKKLEEHWSAIETWTGKHFAYCEAGTIFLSGGPDKAMDLYSLDYWKGKVLPALEEWQSRRDTEN